jgi:hypothetical protein
MERLHAREVYLGKGFAFGHKREGNIELLKRLGSELGFVAGEVPEVSLRGKRVSSSKFVNCWLVVKLILRGVCWDVRTVLRDASKEGPNADTSWAFRQPTCIPKTASYPEWGIRHRHFN